MFCVLFLAALLARDGHLARLRKLDLSYNNNISDEGWMVFCQGLAALKELSELDVSLRPSSCSACGTWFSELLAALTKLPALAELGMQRWVLSESQRKQLEGFNQDNKRNIRFDCWWRLEVSEKPFTSNMWTKYCVSRLEDCMVSCYLFSWEDLKWLKIYIKTVI